MTTDAPFDRTAAWELLVAHYGDWSYDDPEWVEEMLDILEKEGPGYLDD